MNEATDSVNGIVKRVMLGLRTVKELRDCGCDDCRKAIAILESTGHDAENIALATGTCQCCGKRRGKRIGPPSSKRYLCQECMTDPSPTFEGCKHGEEDGT